MTELYVMQRYLPVSYTHLDVYKRQAEIKAKEADKVPKNKSKELATAL